MSSLSTLATNLAASVAQTAHNAQKAAREQDKRRVDREADQADFSQLIAEQIDAPGDATDPDAQLPDRQAPGYENLYPPSPQTIDPDASPPTNPDAPTPVESFQHIDVQA